MADQPIDTAFVEILPDLDKFEASAERQVARKLRDIGKEAEKSAKQVEDSFRVSGKNAEKAFDGVGKSARGAFRDIERGAKNVEGSFIDLNGRLRDSRGRFLKLGDDASTSLQGVSENAGHLTKALSGLGARGGVPGILALGAAAAVAAGPIASLGSALADLAGFAVLIPSAMAVAAAAIAPLAIAFQNFSDAIEAVASGDLEKIDEALKKLSPSARSVAKEFGKLLPQFRSLQRTVQEAFFAPLRGDLTAITRNLLPTLKTGLAGVAGAFGNLFSEVGKFFAAPARLKLINDVFAITKGLVNSLTPVVLKLLGAFEAVAQAILPRFDDISFALQKIIGGFADWLTEAAKSGKLADFLDDAKATLGELVDLGKAVGRLLVAVFGDLDDSGRDFIGTLTDVVDKMTAFFNSAEGQQAIQDTIEAVKTLSGVILFLADAFVTIEKFGIRLKNFWEGVGEFFSNLGSDIGDGFTDAKDAVVGFVEDAVSFVSGLPAKIGAFLSSLPGVFLQWINNAFDSAMFAIGVGIGLVIAAVTRLPGMIVDAVKQLPGLLGTFFSNLWENIKTGAVNAFDAVVGFVRELPSKLLSAGQAVVTSVTGFFSRAFEGAKKRVQDAITSIIGFVRNLPSRLGAFVSDVGGQIANVIKSMLNRAISKINEGIAKVDSFLPGDALPRIPSLAKGGIASATPGGRIVRVAEAGQAEAIAPLDKLMGMIQNAVGGGGINFAPGSIVNQFDGAVPTPSQAFQLGQAIGDGIATTVQRRNVRTQVRTI